MFQGVMFEGLVNAITERFVDRSSLALAGTALGVALRPIYISSDR